MQRINNSNLVRRWAIAIVLVGVSLSSVAHATIGLKIATVTWDAKQPTHPGVQLNPVLGNNMIGLIVNKTWTQIQTAELCSGMKAQMTKANALGHGINAYPDSNWSCSIGDITNLNAKLSGKNTVELSFNVSGNRLEDKFTQPSVAGKYADPKLVFVWDMAFVIDLKVSGSSPYLSITKATAQVQNIKTDSNNFAGDIAVYWLGIGDEVKQRVTAKAIDFTNLTNKQLTAQSAALQPPGNYVLAGVWVQNDYVYIGYTPPSLGGNQIRNSTFQGRLTWPVSSYVNVASCRDISINAETIVGPPALLNPEPAKFDQNYPRFTWTPENSVVSWYSLVPTLAGGGQMACAYNMTIPNGVASVNAVSNKPYPDPAHNGTIMQLNFTGDGNFDAVLAPANNINFTGAWSGNNISSATSHGLVKQKTLIDHGVGQMGIGVSLSAVAAAKSPAALAAPAVANTGVQQRILAPAAAQPIVTQQRVGGAMALPARAMTP